MEKYQPTICECCGQTTTYRLGLDRGSVEIVIDILKGISAKNLNEIHPTKELGWSKEKDKQWFVTNLSRPRFHGLIAYVKNKPGYYCLTKKAGEFLRGKSIPQFAIVSKVTGHQEGYWQPERYRITRGEVLKDDDIPYWEGDQQRMIDYLDPVEKSGQQTLLFMPRQSYNYVLRQGVKS